jgi:hypothetical protein
MAAVAGDVGAGCRDAHRVGNLRVSAATALRITQANSVSYQLRNQSSYLRPLHRVPPAGGGTNGGG